MIRIALILIFFATSVFAVEPDEILSDPVLETRARDISTNLRCVVCQNEAIDSSNAGVARDLRLLVRERLMLGDTDSQVYDYVVARYGDFVLFKPRWKPSTYALWLAPFLGALIGLFIVLGMFRRVAKTEDNDADELSDAEQAAMLDATKQHVGHDYR